MQPPNFYLCGDLPDLLDDIRFIACLGWHFGCPQGDSTIRACFLTEFQGDGGIAALLNAFPYRRFHVCTHVGDINIGGLHVPNCAGSFGIVFMGVYDCA